MRYAVSLPPFASFSDVRALADLARQAERLGWDGFFLWDHQIYGPLTVADPWIALTAIALATERMRIGTLVTPLPRRRPTKLARETVTLDHLSGGRLVLGVGIGAGPWEWEYFGEESDPKVRGAMLDEGLEVLIKLWRGDPFSHHGAHYTITGDGGPAGDQASFLPPARQQPRIPIWVAGEWPNKPPFRRAARWDGMVPLKRDSDGLLTPDELRAAVAHTLAERQSGQPFEVIASGRTPEDDPARAAEIVAEYAAAGATWWIEDTAPWRYGWTYQGDWPGEQMRARVLQGPPQSSPDL
jgi:alkanesulfonate monooxygenase SsuD/methylene tetrahydromethanopterin reductase-like flavin-dependent oxidoreductase (luciferase family)